MPWRLAVGLGGGGAWGLVQIGCFKLPGSRNLKHWGVWTSRGSWASLDGQNFFFTCLSVPLFDVISVAISELIGSPLAAELVDFSAAQTTEGSPSGSLSIQPPQPPQRDYLPIRFAGSGSLTCSIGVFCPCRPSSGGNVDFPSRTLSVHTTVCRR